MSWFGGALAQPNSVLYLSKDGGAGVPVPKCVKTKGSYMNTPCYTARKINKATGQATDTLALLSGDPTVGRK